METALASFKAKLFRAVLSRVESIPYSEDPTVPRVCVLFSGGIDCIVVAAMLAEALPEREPIELINVAFENPRQTQLLQQQQKQWGRICTEGFSDDAIFDVPDRKTGRQGVEELRRIYPGREWRFVE
ncbi:hypothetical protein EV182_007928, partial [Spiromyces aspiralis]